MVGWVLAQGGRVDHGLQLTRNGRVGTSSGRTGLSQQGRLTRNGLVGTRSGRTGLSQGWLTRNGRVGTVQGELG